MKRMLLGCALLLSFCAVATFAQGKKDAELTASDGVKLRVTYYAAPKPGPGVLLLHACNMDRKSWETLAPKLTAAGFHVLALDLRGFGESGGERFASLAPQQRGELGRKWPGDIDAAFAYLREQPGVDKVRIGAAGASCGVDNSIQLARRHPEVRSLVLLSGTTVQEGLGFMRRADWLPVLAAASENDGATLPMMRWMMAFYHNPQNQLLEYKAAGHGTEMFAVENELEPKIVRWFEKTLPNAPAALPDQTASRPRAGKPTPQETFWDLMLRDNDFAGAVKLYEETKKREPNVVLFPEGAMNLLGYQLMQAGTIPEAIEVFKLNVVAYPLSPNVYDSLADAYVANNENELAIQNSEKALELLDKTPGLDAQFRQALRESAEGKLRQLRPGKAPAAAPAKPPA